ncbi:MAG: peptide deformylase [Firmicutes bacterium]|nr:peptide deformylase [Bacillota bacterium]
MALRQIITGLHPVLRRRAQPVKKINGPVLNLLQDMTETMYHAPGVGLAAPQIGISRRLVVIDPGEEQLLQLINPCILEKKGEIIDLEGCLSLPGLTGEVPRAEWVAVEYLDPRGKKVRLQAEGLMARILQHEIDHLEGVLFIDKALRMVDPEGERAKEGKKSE